MRIEKKKYILKTNEGYVTSITNGKLGLAPNIDRAKIYNNYPGRTVRDFEERGYDVTLIEVPTFKSDATEKTCGYCGSRVFNLVIEVQRVKHIEFKKNTVEFIESKDVEKEGKKLMYCNTCGKLFRELEKWELMQIKASEAIYNIRKSKQNRK